jgi:hypothetical protein
MIWIIRPPGEAPLRGNPDGVTTAMYSPGGVLYFASDSKATCLFTIY